MMLEIDLEERCNCCGHALKLQVKEQEGAFLNEISCVRCGFRFSEENKPLILIADAGWESIVGGCVVGVYDYIQKQFESKTIEVEYFQNFLRDESRYPDKIVSAVDEIFIAWNINPDTHVILIKNTHLMSILRSYLEARHYNWYRFKTCKLVESLTKKAFEDHLLSLGVPKEAIALQGRARLRFLLAWVLADESREKLVKKTGL
ncbi:MAG: hypothetical protein QXJ68_04520 [Methanocellales archaeon]